MIIYYFFPLSLVPPAAKEGKGDCEFPYALLGFSYYPFVTPGTLCQGAVTAGGVLSFELSISGGAVLRCGH